MSLCWVLEDVTNTAGMEIIQATINGRTVPVYVRGARRLREKYGERFFTMFDKRIYELAKQQRRGATVRVFLMLPAWLSWKRWRRLNQDALAKELGLNPVSVLRAMEDLEAAGVVKRRYKRPHTEWLLSPDWGFRGNVRQHKVVKAMHAKDRTPPMPTPAEWLRNVA
jgi:hypothetical protein